METGSPLTCLVTPTGFEPNKPTFLKRKILDFIAYFKIFVENLSKKLSPFNVVFIQNKKPMLLPFYQPCAVWRIF